MTYEYFMDYFISDWTRMTEMGTLLDSLQSGTDNTVQI